MKYSMNFRSLPGEAATPNMGMTTAYSNIE
jgi:hypothetical protein